MLFPIGNARLLPHDYLYLTFFFFFFFVCLSLSLSLSLSLAFASSHIFSILSPPYLSVLSTTVKKPSFISLFPLLSGQDSVFLAILSQFLSSRGDHHS